jgi:hypothetical protein
METDVQQARLTWYPGSVRPYASLWHTVLRVTALNSLRFGDLPEKPRPLDASAGAHHSHVLLYNTGTAIDMDALASALGETPSVFRWSHFGALAPWLRHTVTPGLRLCMPCLAKGYHSALFSLRFLSVCPIHGTPLVAQCRCGRPFSDRLCKENFAQFEGCACYQLSFFTRQSCRLPTLDASLTDVFDPVVAWLERLSQVVRPQQDVGASRHSENPAWLNLIFEWSQTLGLSYPTCFQKPDSFSHRILTHCESGKLLVAKPAGQHCQMGNPASFFMQDSPATLTYRAMSRYLRRHLVHNLAQWVPRLRGATGPQGVADLLRSDRRALLAFAEMLWSRQVSTRRWPARMTPSHDALPGAPWQLNQAGRRWVEYHAAGVALIALWEEALMQATSVARSNDIDVVSGFPAISDLCDWSALVHQDGSLRFLGLGADGLGFPVRSFPDKQARRDAFHRAQENARQVSHDACCGPCLTWTPCEGWYVTAAARPADNGWRRHRLLGLKEGKPKFWIFRDGGRFAVRLCEARLQTFDTTAAGAIKALRQCLPLYNSCYSGCPADGYNFS